MTLPATIRVNATVPFPARVLGAGGIAVSKVNGVWTIEPDFSAIATILASAALDPSSKQIWVYDPVEDSYAVMTLADLGDALYSATSTTSLSVATGSQAFTTQSGKDFSVGSFVLAYSAATPTNYMVGQVTGYTATTLTVNVLAIGGSGTVADWVIRLASSPGIQGISSGLAYLWDTGTSDADPGAGKVRANNATFASITALYISETDNDGAARAALFATWDDSTSTIKGRIKIYDPITPTNFMIFDLTAYADSGDYDELTVTPVTNGGSFSASEALRMEFVATGDKGNTGPAGEVTSTGASTAGNVPKFTDTSADIIDDSGVPYDSIVRKDATATIAKGYTLTPYDNGTVSSGTLTPNPANGNYQYYTNDGAHTLAAPSSDCAIDILMTNGASAGAVTFSGFTVGAATGSALNTTNTNKFLISIRRINGTSTYSIYALQ